MVADWISVKFKPIDIHESRMWRDDWVMGEPFHTLIASMAH